MAQCTDPHPESAPSARSSLSTEQQARLVTEAVLSVLEKTWVPNWVKILYPGLTYFSYFDHWYYIAVMDDRVCPDCGPRDQRTYYGDSLRLEFPWLEVESSYSISPHVHPRCRCALLREEWLRENMVLI